MFNENALLINANETVRESADGSEDENVNEEMDKVECEGADGCEKKGDELSLVIVNQGILRRRRRRRC